MIEINHNTDSQSFWMFDRFKQVKRLRKYYKYAEDSNFVFVKSISFQPQDYDSYIESLSHPFYFYSWNIRFLYDATYEPDIIDKINNLFIILKQMNQQRDLDFLLLNLCTIENILDIWKNIGRQGFSAQHVAKIFIPLCGTEAEPIWPEFIIPD